VADRQTSLRTLCHRMVLLLLRGVQELQTESTISARTAACVRLGIRMRSTGQRGAWAVLLQKPPYGTGTPVRAVYDIGIWLRDPRRRLIGHRVGRQMSSSWTKGRKKNDAGDGSKERQTGRRVKGYNVTLRCRENRTSRRRNSAAASRRQRRAVINQSPPEHMLRFARAAGSALKG